MTNEHVEVRTWVKKVRRKENMYSDFHLVQGRIFLLLVGGRIVFLHARRSRLLLHDGGVMILLSSMQEDPCPC
jgi:hypothetical protein